MSDERPNLTQELSTEARLEIEAKTEEYQRKLQRSKEKLSTAQLSERQVRFRQGLIQKEIEDDARDLEDIRKEEKFNISLNFGLSLFIVLAFVGWAVIQGDQLLEVMNKISGFFIQYFSWFYILTSSLFLIFLLYLALSKFGNVVLGDPGEKPEFNFISWIAMLFSAGMGAGLLFWGGAEPLFHYFQPPTGPGGTAEAARQAMVYTSFHWGLHAWGIYTICSVGVAYYGFRKRKKYLISSSVMDVFQSKKVNRGLKIICDLTATVGIVFGVAASLGMGIVQTAGGLDYVFGINADNSTGKIVIMALMTIFFIMSAMTGLEKGIQILSNLNMILAVVLMLFLFAVGPKLFILKVFVDSLGMYLSQAFALGFAVAPFTPEYEKWMGSWTLVYFTWWIAWAPFVGIFIARISKGRTIRELILGSLIVPTTFTVFWFSVFGGTSLHMHIFNEGEQTQYEQKQLFADDQPAEKASAASSATESGDTEASAASAAETAAQSDAESGANVSETDLATTTVVGNNAKDGGTWKIIQEKGVTVALFALLERHPLYKLTAGLSILLVFTFLVTSADSATFVISMMTTEGDLEPKIGMKILWGTVLALVTLSLVLGGGIKALQAASLSTAFPFNLVLILMVISIYIRLSIQVDKDRI